MVAVQGFFVFDTCLVSLNAVMKDRTLNQDSWKRSQVRLPQPLYDDVFEYAKKHGISLNQAIIELLDKGLLRQNTDLDAIMIELQLIKEQLKKPQ